MLNTKKQAFTLVELIVVITILAVLGTISMLTFQSYTLTARDSVRITDLKNIRTSIEFARIEQGKYIVPDDGTDITYSGDVVVRNQGVFGSGARRKSGKLDKTPLDPLTQDEYTFSVTSNGGEFELGAIMEGNDIVHTTPSLINSTYAATTYRAYINGTYNGKMAKTSSGGVDYIFALPSIISSDLSTPTISYITTNNKVVIKGHDNIPSHYNNQDNGSSLESEREFVNENEVLVFSGSFDDLKGSLTTDPAITESFQIDLIENLQEAYSGTLVENASGIKEILDIDTVNNSEGTKFLAQTLIKSSVDSRFEITASTYENGGGSDGGVSTPPGMTCPNSDLSTPESNFTFHSYYKVITGYSSSGPKDIIIPCEIGGAAVAGIANGVFEAKNITSVIIPESVESIGTSAFENNKLTTLVLPNSLGDTGGSAFRDNDLTSVVISDGISSIGYQSFQGNKISSISIPESVTTIDNFAFRNNKLTNVVIPGNIEDIQSFAFENNDITDLTIEEGVESIGSNAFAGNYITNLVIPSTVESISSHAFRDNNLENLTIPVSVTSIGTSTFRYQTNSGLIVNGPSSGYVKDTYDNNPNTQFDKNPSDTYVAY